MTPHPKTQRYHDAQAKQNFNSFSEKKHNVPFSVFFPVPKESGHESLISNRYQTYLEKSNNLAFPSQHHRLS
jgi:hypothetical protein